MITIKKRNFKEQLCPFCEGTEHNVCDPSVSLTCSLYHSVPDFGKYIEAEVKVPRCKQCAEKMSPIFYICIAAGVVCFVLGYLYWSGTHGIWSSLFIGAVALVAGAIAMYFILTNAFSIAYGQNSGSYEIVQVLEKKYGWKSSKPGRWSRDKSMTDEKLQEMFDDLYENYDCNVKIK